MTRQLDPCASCEDAAVCGPVERYRCGVRRTAQRSIVQRARDWWAGLTPLERAATVVAVVGWTWIAAWSLPSLLVPEPTVLP